MPELEKNDDVLDELVDAVETDDTEDSAEKQKEEALKNISETLNPDTDDVGDSDNDDTGDSDVNIDDSVATDDSEFNVLGWDKETLEKLREINPKLLDDVKVLIDKSEKIEPDSEDEDTDDTKVSSVKDTEFDLSKLDELRKTDSNAADLLETMITQVKTLTTSLNTVTAEEQERKEKVEQETLVRNFRHANSQMDELSKDFPILGLEKDLPKTSDGAFDSRSGAVRERSVVWNNAVGMYNAGLGDTFEDALADAVTLYKGKNGENLSMRQVVKDLNKRKKSFTARPTHKQTQKKGPAKGTDEFKISIVSEALKAAGIPE
ncbi:hypothetical protein LCGC14_2132260 [marine sediment metagenome]|uniref:Uncharacterized protein n=1 Tax=marine sediment metagenome TaxID=412755 RepID=A0A0F9GE08_9ZZZZ